MQRNETAAIIFALLACLIWAGNFVVARGVQEWIPPFTLAFWRWIVALIVILPIGYLKTRQQWPLIRHHWKYLFCMGAFGVGIFNTLIYIAAHYTTTHHIALISSMTPIIILLIAGILGMERLSRRIIAGSLCAFMGVLVIIAHGSFSLFSIQLWNIGDILLVISAFIWSGWNIALRRKPEALSARALLTVMMVVGTLLLAPFYLWEALSATTTPFTLQAWLVYLYIGVFSSVLAWFLWQYAVEVAGSVKTSLIYYSIPVFSSVLAILILGEPLEHYHITGFILVFTGIIIASFHRRKEQKMKAGVKLQGDAWR